MPDTVMSPGYHIYNLSTPAFYTKGSVLHLMTDGAVVPINTKSSGSYNDYNWKTGTFIEGSTANVYVNLLTNKSSETVDTTVFNISYQTAGIYNMNAHFICDQWAPFSAATTIFVNQRESFVLRLRKDLRIENPNIVCVTKFSDFLILLSQIFSQFCLLLVESRS